MTLAEKIAAMKAQLLEKKNALQAITDKMAALADGDDMDDNDVAAAEELDQGVNKLIADIERAEKHQLTLARNARPAGGSHTSTTQDTIDSLRGGNSQNLPAERGAPSLALRGHMQRKPNINLFVRSAMAAFESHHTRYPVDQIVEARWPGQQDLLEVSRLITGYRLKGVQNPAMTSVPEWAGALVRETLAAFMDLLQPESVIPRLGLDTLDFGGAQIIKVPYRLPTAANGNDLSGAFRKEGDPIRIGAARMGTKSLRAYGMGVIGTFTMEMLEASPLNFEQAVQRWMIEDTAKVLDTVFLDDQAEVADTRPAGIRNGIAAGDIHDGAAATDPAAIQAVLRAAVSTMTGNQLGRRPVWLMHPDRATGLASLWNSVGLPAFPSMAQNTLMGYPVISSITVPANLVYLIDTAEVAFAGGTPRFSYSEEASVVEQDGLPITNGVQAEVETLDAGVPARSLWQTHSGGIRALWNVTWARMRDHSVQVITGAAW